MGRKGGRNNRKGQAKAAQSTVAVAQFAELAAVFAAPADASVLQAFVAKAQEASSTVVATEALAAAFADKDQKKQVAALKCTKALMEAGSFWPFVSLLAKVFELAGHKKSRDIREAADAVCALVDPKTVPAAWAFAIVQACLLSMTKRSKWQSQCAALQLIKGLSLSGTPDTQLLVSRQMVALVGPVSDLMWSTKDAVQKDAESTMTAMCATIGNPDLVPFYPQIVNAIRHPEDVEETVFKLASTTFVQPVSAAALSVMVPLLARAFREPKVSIKRKASVITENVGKLVRDPLDVEAFLPVLSPALAKIVDEVADPECRERSATALKILTDLGAKGEAARAAAPKPAEFEKAVVASLKAPAAVQGFAVAAVQGLVEARLFKTTVWSAGLEVAFALVGATAAVDGLLAECTTICGVAVDDGASKDEELDDDFEGEELCDCKFSLAYGANILLNNARIRMRRGGRYGIIAGKSAGKTTLLRAIANYQIDGFPPASQLRTIFVETDIQGTQTTMNVVEFVIDTISHILTVDEAHVRATLTEMGFNEEMQAGPITRLSGGWKMKLALVRGMLCKTDIYLMDEPTNHLDVVNVQWVVDYLTGPLCKNVTSMIVSHDSKFLDKVCTHIIHFDDLRLKTYPGNLAKFVEKKPETKSHFDLTQSSLKFSFPVPVMINGIKNRSTPLMRLDKLDFRYPSATKNQLNKVSVTASMASRVAIVGANGAGKSTMIKVLTGEMEPTRGAVWKHPDMRFAYVAQHAFHHIEQHLSKTPNEYIQWRYSSGEDKEALIKSTAIVTEEEEKIMELKIEVPVVDKDSGKTTKYKWQIKRIVSRRKVRRSYQYEVQFVGQSQDDNRYYTVEALEKFGWGKKVKELDRRLVALEGLRNRPLTTANVQKHLQAVGLEPEFSTHNRLRDLSGGQKVKVVLGACTWAQPHIIILDEPTNYLDRDSLGALAGAIREFAGGVVLITHNQEFADVTTKVTWVVANNQVVVNGDAEWEKYALEAAAIMEEEDDDEYRDSSGNTVKKITKHKPFDELTSKEVRTYKKAIRKKMKASMPLEDWEEEYAVQWDMIQ